MKKAEVIDEKTAKPEIAGPDVDAVLRIMDAMERAWNNRDDWQAMGEKALMSIARIVPKCPEDDFANQLNKLINEY